MVQLFSVQVSRVVFLLEIGLVVSIIVVVATVLPDDRGFLFEKSIISVLEMISCLDKVIVLLSLFLLVSLVGGAVAKDLFQFFDAVVLDRLTNTNSENPPLIWESVKKVGSPFLAWSSRVLRSFLTVLMFLWISSALLWKLIGIDYSRLKLLAFIEESQSVK